MSVNVSSYQSPVGLSRSAALSHVYIQYPPLRCWNSGTSCLFYDDGNKLIISPTSDGVHSWKLFPFNPHVNSTYLTITEGPILSIRYSLDEKILAVQRSSQEIQFWNKETGDSFIQRCKSESDNILGFFWTDCCSYDFVIVKASGLDLFSLDSESKSLHLVETKKLNVSWYIYSHDSRLVLLASGMQCKSFTGYQLRCTEIVRLPRFEMAMAKSDANSKPVLAADDVHIITVYGRIYCLQVDRLAMQLHLYRLYSDTVIQQGSLPIYSSRISVSVVDNVLLVHETDAKVVILYDIYSESRAPISAPLPLLLRGFPRVVASSSQSTTRDSESTEAGLTHSEAVIYGDGWTFLCPDLICDIANGLVWKIHLDLEALSASSSEIPLVLEFLQRRKLEASKAKELSLAMVRTIILERRPVPIVAKSIDVLVTSYSYSMKRGGNLKETKAVKSSSSGSAQENNAHPAADDSTKRADDVGKSIVNERSHGAERKFPGRPTDSSVLESEDTVLDSEAQRDEIRQAIMSTQFSGSGSSPLSAIITEQVTTAAISPDEMYTFVFAPVEEEMSGDSSYLVAVIIEFLRSTNLERIKVHPNVYALIIQLLARNDRYAELGMFIVNKILEPSKEVALQLLESGRQHLPTRKLGLDMLRQLALHHDYVLLLLQDGYYLEALRYARRTKVNTVRPSLFLEAAYASNDSQHLAAVLRFFSDFIPGFKDSTDHNTYNHILAEMNSSVAVA
ncbi:regulator of MON1-CCZ1 complex [Impatiens glandulifera]|uniref:regulator of MON1-CCZ1 complex n=1 Tax=Impatiens glandulifera TaxID=253017 RepID=UPI001FB156DC|nr:regulator of MON1-CCZ1 complex [Impatiens glandulifera]